MKISNYEQKNRLIKLKIKLKERKWRIKSKFKNIFWIKNMNQ